jgi:type VI secretion system protein ImpM
VSDARADLGRRVGFYGKLPSHGDFLRRRVPDAFVSVWDRWLQECLVASRAALADRWLDVYLTSPAWRFVSAPGALGPRAIIGLMVPSVDRVGRYFHLTFAATLPDGVTVVDAAEAGATFLDQAEQLAVETLAADSIDFDRFDRAVRELAVHLEPLNTQPPALLAAAPTPSWPMPSRAGASGSMARWRWDRCSANSAPSVCRRSTTRASSGGPKDRNSCSRRVSWGKGCHGRSRLPPCSTARGSGNPGSQFPAAAKTRPDRGANRRDRRSPDRSAAAVVPLVGAFGMSGACAR